MDRAGDIRRNARVQPSAPQPSTDTVPAAPSTAAAVMVDVVVLSADAGLYEAIRRAVGERNPVWRARTAEEAVDLLLVGRCGVLVLDMAVVTTQPAALVEQIVEQFPSVVVVVAGRRSDESLLAGLIRDGLVYRYMHKPLSPKRAGMFLNAAIRRHAQRRADPGAQPLLPLVSEPQPRPRARARSRLLVGVGGALCVALVAAMLAGRSDDPPVPAPPPAGSAARPAAVVVPAGPLADPVLSRARAALAAGRYDAPPGRNALDLYFAALLARPDNAEARAGLDATIARLLQAADRAASSGDAAEARRIAQRVLRVQADHPGARALLARLEPPPAPAGVPSAAAAPRPAPARPAATTAAVQPPPQRVAAVSAPPARPAPAPPLRTASAPPARSTPTRVVRVQPDPLTPRVIGPGVLPTSPSPPPRRQVRREFGAPAQSGHPIAGDERRPDAAAGPAPAAADAGPPPTPALQDRDLEPVATPGPVYPAEAFRQRLEGWVAVDFTVTDLGTTRDVEVVAAEPQGVFDAAAVQAVAAWTYRPRLRQGLPVAERSSVTLRFNVED